MGARWASVGVLLLGSDMVLMKQVEVMSSSIVSTLTWQPVQDGTFVRLSLRRQIDSKLHLTLQLSAANKHNTHSQYSTGVCVCVCAVGSDLTSHVRTPSGSHQHTCWRRAEWEPCLSCRHSVTCQRINKWIRSCSTTHHTLHTDPVTSWASQRDWIQIQLDIKLHSVQTVRDAQHLFSWQNHELVRLLVCLTHTDWLKSLTLLFLSHKHSWLNIWSPPKKRSQETFLSLS